MAKIVIGSSSLTQPLLLYPGLGLAMLDNIGLGIKGLVVVVVVVVPFGQDCPAPLQLVVTGTI
jgi:hypothetical protein